MEHKELYNDAKGLLCELIRMPSFSREESETARILAEWLGKKLGAGGGEVSEDGGTGKDGIHRHGNNVWVKNLHFDPAKPTILLCSHHDTVRPGEAWTRDPFDPAIEDSEGSGAESTRNAQSADGTAGNGPRLYGLGSNDAGGSVVSLISAFRHFYKRNNLKYNLILAIVGEEEISGPGGVRSILPELGLGGNAAGADPARATDFAIVGEPTGMQLAIAEKGLLVLDCTAHGKGGHAARDESDNAIYHAVKDIEWIHNYRFPRKSPLFGEVGMNVTIISAGTQHNVVPTRCHFTIDCRVTEQYTNEEVLDIVRRHVTSDVTPRSIHLRASSISPEHPIVRAGKEIGLGTFGSPTTSDQVAITMVPSVKIGPGQSTRSHSADEYILLSEIEQGIDLYIKLLDKIL